jgi:hypothetical protein
MQSTRGCGPCGLGGEPPLPSRDYLCLTLLQAGVAWPQTLPPAPVVSYTTFSPLPPAPAHLHQIQKFGGGVKVGGGLFLWPDPSGCPVPGVSRHLALWSADFPRWHKASAVIRSAWGHSSYHNYFLLTSTPTVLYKTAGSTSELFQIGLLYPQLNPPA